METLSLALLYDSLSCNVSDGEHCIKDVTEEKDIQISQLPCRQAFTHPHLQPTNTFTTASVWLH